MKKVITGELSADLESKHRVQDAGETCPGTSAATSARLRQLQPVPVGVQSWSLDRDCTAGCPRRCLHGG